MKILTGRHKGKKIAYKANPHLRPTADKVRKAIFDMLQGQLEDKNVLDLFSGTGALGFEAISMGAASATFVENDKNQAKKIKQAAEDLGLASQTRVIAKDAIEAISGIAQEGNYFDFIFLDPPYEKGLGLRALEALASSSLTHEDTLVILETRKNENVPDLVGNLKTIKKKFYGDTCVKIYRKI